MDIRQNSNDYYLISNTNKYLAQVFTGILNVVKWKYCAFSPDYVKINFSCEIKLLKWVYLERHLQINCLSWSQIRPPDMHACIGLKTRVFMSYRRKIIFQLTIIRKTNKKKQKVKSTRKVTWIKSLTQKALSAVKTLFLF